MLVIEKLRRPPFLLFLHHAESRIFITLPAQHVVYTNVRTNVLPSLSNFPAAEFYVNQGFIENNEIAFFWASWESHRPLFKSGKKRECNYSSTKKFRFGCLVTRWSEFNLTTNLLYVRVRFFFCFMIINVPLWNLYAGG